MNHHLERPLLADVFFLMYVEQLAVGCCSCPLRCYRVLMLLAPLLALRAVCARRLLMLVLVQVFVPPFRRAPARFVIFVAFAWFSGMSLLRLR